MRRGEEVHPLLQLRLRRACESFDVDARDTHEFLAELAGGLPHDRPRLRAALAPHNLDHLSDEDLPHPIIDELSALTPDIYPATNVVIEIRDPFDEQNPVEKTQVAWRMLGLMAAIQPRLQPLIDLVCSSERTTVPGLINQLHDRMVTVEKAVYKVRAACYDGAMAGVRIEASTGNQIGDPDYPLSARPADPNLVILGSSTPVPLYTKIGKDSLGRTLALSLMHPLILFAFGAPCKGKSYLSRLIAESLHLLLRGINRLPEALRSVTFQIE
jgi:hypothetical protein